MVLGVKIKNNENGLFRLKDGSFSKNGKTYSTLGFAKSSITNDISYYHINPKLLNCDFIIFYDDTTIETIPVKTHIIDYLKREIERHNKRLQIYKQDKFIRDEINKLTNLLTKIEKEGIEIE